MKRLGTEMEALVERLVEIHGEDGICPAADDWRTILGFAEGAPVYILNLLRFKAEVPGDGGSARGSEAYEKYATAVAPAFVRAGGEQVLFGAVGHVFPAASADDWEFVTLARYPSARALAEMWLDPDFIAAHAHRIDGVDDSRVLVLASPLPAHGGRG